MKALPLKTRIYIILLTILACLCLYYGFLSLTIHNLTSVIFFIILSVIAEAAAIQLNNNTAISVTFAMGLSALLIFQSPVIAIVGFFTMILRFYFESGKVKYILNSSLHKYLFNASAYTISLFISTLVYNYASSNLLPINFINFNILGIILSVISYIILDTLIFLILMTLLQEVSLISLLKESMWVVINLIAISPLGVIIAVIYQYYGMFAVLLFFGPLLLARYSFKLYIDMRKIYMETIEALSDAVDAKDNYTNGHSYRVAEYAVAIAKELGFNDSKVETIKTAAILHDIGKIGINDMILNKPTELEDEEIRQIQRHPEIGCNILSKIQTLNDVSNIIRLHHERYDGNGYPNKLKGEDIPIEANIIAISDTFDAMTSDRPYRKAMGRDVAINLILRESGKQFNPLVVDAFRIVAFSTKGTT